MSSNTRRRLTGTVVSNKMDKTVVVRVDRTGRHTLYKKVIRTSSKYMAHDENNECELGDLVVIVESRPISRNKRWAVQEIIRGDASARTTDVSELEGAPEEAMAAVAEEAPDDVDAADEADE